ncbi:MAG: glycosyltransferase family 2 protein [Alphaproteobacteria bacterium]|nr:glycosyltransferase family 2 protein [Alphaproteobacteria bacterium]
MDDPKSALLPLVTIVTVNYDQPEVTCELLRSLGKITYPSVEIIVVDNASPTRPPDMIAEQFPKVRLIRSKANLGFAGGNNLGIYEAHGSYLLLINNDTEVEPGFLEPLIQKLERDPTIGAVSPKIRYFYQKDTIQFAGFTPMNPVTIRNRGIGFNEKDDGQYDEDRETSFAFGAAMLLPVQVVKKVGLMADIFFLYYEELDWIQRIRDAGYRILYVHDSIVYHKDSITTGSLSPLKIYYLNRGRILFMRRNIHGKTALLSILYQIFIAVPKNLSVFLLKGQFSLFKAYARAMGWHLKNCCNPALHQSPHLNT